MKEKTLFSVGRNDFMFVKGKATKKVEGISDKLTDPYMELTDEMNKESKKQLECIFKCLEETGVCTKKGAC